MITITFCPEKGQLHVNGILMAEGSVEELERTDDATLVGMAFGPSEDSPTLGELAQGEDVDVNEFKMTLSLLNVMFPGSITNGTIAPALSLQDLEPWIDGLDESLPLPDIGSFKLTLPKEEDESL